MPTVGRIRDRATFGALRRPAGRAARGPLRASFVPAPPDAAGVYPQVAYAVSRRCGGAVVRNRLRRRLRAAVASRASGLARGAYLVSCAPATTSLGPGELARAVEAALRGAVEAAERPTGGRR